MVALGEDLHFESDLNGVIRHRKGEATQRPRPEVEGAVQGLRQLNHDLFGCRMGIMSTSTAGKGTKRMGWLDERRIFERTGVPRTNVTFCTTRAEKGQKVQRTGCTHFVDDHAEPLIVMAGIVSHRFLFNPPSGELDLYGVEELEGITVVWGWPELVEAVKATVPLLAAAA